MFKPCGETMNNLRNKQSCHNKIFKLFWQLLNNNGNLAVSCPGANSVENLFCRSCFTSTLSPRPMFDSSAFLFLSAYTFAFAFIPLSLSRTSLATISSLNSASFVCIFLQKKISAGLTPVMVCGVDLYAKRYLRTSSFGLCNPLPFQQRPILSLDLQMHLGP